MDKAILDKAMLRVEALEKEIADLRFFIRTYHKLSKSPSSSIDVSNMANIQLDGKKGIYSLPSPSSEIIAAAREALRIASPSPILIGDLYDQLEAAGLVIGGKNPRGNLSAKISQPTDLVYVKDEGWYYRPAENEEAVASSEAKVERVFSPFDFLNPKPSPSEAQD